MKPTRAPTPRLAGLDATDKETWVHFQHGPHDVSVLAVVVDGRPRVIGLRIEPALSTEGDIRGGATVADLVLEGSPLRGLPLTRLAESAVAAQRLEFKESLLRARMPEPGRQYGDEHYEEVARIVREARAKGVMSGRQAVSVWGHVSLAAADKWIRRAKDMGLLAGDDRRRARRGEDHG